MEIWKEINEIENIEVSNYGRFRSKDSIVEYNRKGKMCKRTIKGHIIKQSMDNNGYLKLIVCRNGVCKGFVSHRIVAKYFLKDFDENLEVDHINDIRNDNRVENLRMVTRLENVRKASTLEKIRNYLKNIPDEERKKRIEKAKKTMLLNGTKNGRKKKPVVKIGYNSIEFIDDIYLLEGFNRVKISIACTGKSKHNISSHYYKGYEWFYKEDYEKML